MLNDFLWSGTNDFEKNFIAKLRNMLMIEKENQPIFQFLCINLMEMIQKLLPIISIMQKPQNN